MIYVCKSKFNIIKIQLKFNKMAIIKVKADSKIAKILAMRAAHKEAIRQYINGKITLNQLKEQGVRLAQPVQLSH